LFSVPGTVEMAKRRAASQFAQKDQPSAKKAKHAAMKSAAKKNGNGNSNNPACLVCQSSRLASATGYVHHLHKSHKMTLRANGIYLVCGCGTQVRTRNPNSDHKGCGSATFTVHNINDESPQCTLCSAYPTNCTGYATHMIKTHRSSLKSSNLYLKCACGKKITHHRIDHTHTAQCKGIKFTLHRRADEGDGEESMDGEETLDDEEEKVNGNEEEDVEKEDDGDAYESDEDDVDLDGTHYPVAIGEIINEKYRVMSKLGHGGYSTVWLAEDMDRNRKVALKIGISNEEMGETASDEMKLLERIRDGDASHPHRDKVVQLIDSFTLSGTAGDHYCFVLEPLTCNLLRLIRKSNYEGLGIEEVKHITRQVLEGLHYMHTECQMIHTDIKPENVLVSMENNRINKVKIADLGNACYLGEHYMEDIQTVEYRSPEVLVGAPHDWKARGRYSETADIWSTACMSFELATGEHLFQPDEDCQDVKAYLLTKITNTLGPLPAEVYKNGKHWAKYFNENGQLLNGEEQKPYSVTDILTKNYHWSYHEASQFVSFLSPMLQLDYEKRATAAQCLQHEWLQPDDARPAPAAASAAVKEEKEVAAAAMKEEENDAAAAEGEKAAATAV
ncbi:hypothetical protein PENTCL1PPCAC_25280, partial [Pristionchus entomophagus]